MFLQSLTQHQGHLLTTLAVFVVVMGGFLFLFGFFNKKRTKTKPDELEIPNFNESLKRKSKKRRDKSGKKK